MNLYDISWPITPEMTGYKDKKSVSFEQVKNFEQDNVRESIIHLSSHAGTHIDAPAHFIKNGKTIEQISITDFSGPCKVFDLTHLPESISRENLLDLDIQKSDIILFKTKNSTLAPTDKFNPNFIYLDHSGAQYLADKNIQTIGIDYLGIERNQPNHETHTILMHNNITIIEGLRLDHVPAGLFFLWCMPLAIIGLEAAPARAILIQESA